VTPPMKLHLTNAGCFYDLVCRDESLRNTLSYMTHVVAP